MPQLNYNVDYELNGERFTETQISAPDPGLAMAKVLKQQPDAKVLKAWIEGVFRDGCGYQEWLAPPHPADAATGSKAS